MDAQQQPPIRVVFVLLPGSLVLDWAGPAEALRIANQRLLASGRPERFAIEFASPRPTSTASVGVTLAGLSPLPTQWDGPAWVVLVGLPGDTIAIDTPETQDLLHWLRGQRFERGRVELVTVCAGAAGGGAAGGAGGGPGRSRSARARCWRRMPAPPRDGAPPRTTITWTNCARRSRAATW